MTRSHPFRFLGAWCQEKVVVVCITGAVLLAGSSCEEVRGWVYGDTGWGSRIRAPMLQLCSGVLLGVEFRKPGLTLMNAKRAPSDEHEGCSFWVPDGINNFAELHHDLFSQASHLSAPRPCTGRQQLLISGTKFN